MMIVSFIFIPNILCSVWVAFSIISIEIGVVGYMALWHVNLDSISMINLIMCIGFSVDFTAHICYAYMSSTARTSEEKVKECLYNLGLPIFQGAVSTILGMIALLLANNYLFGVFFKMVFLVVFCGAMHGLFLLPVLLSLFGPGSCTSPVDDEGIKMSNVEKALPHPYCIPHPQFTLNSNLGTNLKTQKLSSLEKYSTGKKYKSYELEKDLGLGTSEENSSESSSHSNKKQPIEDDVVIDRTYPDVWRRGSDAGISQFHSAQVLDIYGNDSERNYYKRLEENRRRYDLYQARTEDPRARIYDQRQRRRYSPPEQRHYPGNNAALARSSSYHNIVHPRFVQELRFP